MKRNTLWTAALACALTCTACSATDHGDGNGGGNDGNKGIVILHENDAHCKYERGYAAIDRMRSSIADTAWVGVASVGDFIQGAAAGAVSRGQYIVDIMRPLGYDAITIGNHEFDYGIDRMLTLLGWSGGDRMAVTCANFINTDADTLVFSPYVMRQYGDKRVAYVGILTAATHEGEPAAFKTEGGDALPYRIADGAEMATVVQSAVDKARNAGADYVVALSHLGNDSTLRYTTTQALVAATRGIDAVFDGHSHRVYTNRCRNIDGKLIPVTQTGTQFANIGKLYISPRGDITSTLVGIDSAEQYRGPATTAVSEAVAAVDNKMKTLDEETVAYAPFFMSAKLPSGKWTLRNSETNLGDLVADAFREYTGADIGLCTAGEIRDNIDSGRVSHNDIIDVLPFFDDMILINATGAAIQAALDSCNFNVPMLSGAFTQVSGMTYTIITGKPSRVVDIKIMNRATGQYEPVRPDGQYTLATSKYTVDDYVYGLPLKGMPVVRNYPSTATDTDMLLWYVKERLNGRIPEEYRNAQGRITIVMFKE